MESGGRLAAKAEVTDSLLDRCKPIAGTPEDCIAAIEEYREAGCTHVMLELWGDRRHEQIRLFGERGAPILQVMTEYDPAAFDAFEQAGGTTKEAAGYDALAGRVTSRVAESLLDAVGAERGTRLLDVATGPGYVDIESRGSRRRAGGPRLFETMLAHARTQVADVEFVHGDATALPFGGRLVRRSGRSVPGCISVRPSAQSLKRFGC